MVYLVIGVYDTVTLLSRHDVVPGILRSKVVGRDGNGGTEKEIEVMDGRC